MVEKQNGALFGLLFLLLHLLVLFAFAAASAQPTYYYYYFIKVLCDTIKKNIQILIMVL